MYGLESPTCIYTEQKNNIKNPRSEDSRGVWTAVALLVVVSSTRKEGHE